MSLELNIKIEHLDYLIHDFGIDGFIKKFRQEKCIAFLRWAKNSLNAQVAAEENSHDTYNLSRVYLPEAHYDIGAYALSVISYRLVCEAMGEIPDKYIQLINNLRSKIDEIIKADDLANQSAENSVAHLSQDQFREKLAKEIINIYNEVLNFGNQCSQLPLSVQNISPRLKYNFNVGNGRSFAQGTSLVSLSLSPFVSDQQKGNFFYWEYKSIQSKPDIGEFSTKNWELPIYALVCHELAHSFQMAIEKESVKNGRHDLKDLMSKPHGKGWQQIYKIFRDKFVNPYLSSSAKSD